MNFKSFKNYFRAKVTDEPSLPPKQKALIEDWCFLGDCLTGKVYDHPRIRDGELATTTKVLKINNKTAETKNTIYRLGRKLNG